MSEWQAFAQLEPFGTETQYLGHAITSSVVANANRGKNQKPFKVDDFMPRFEKQEQTTDQMLQIAQMLTAVNGGIDLREDQDG